MVRLILLAVGALLALGCSDRGDAEPTSEHKVLSKGSPADRDRVVATIGGDPITVGMLSDELNRQNSYLRAGFSSPSRKRSFLKNYLRFQVLVREARRLGLDRDPAVTRQVRRALVDRLMDTLPPLERIQDVSDAEIEQYYNKNKELYHRPAQVRASQIVAATEREALELAALAKEKADDPATRFAALAEQRSIDPVAKKHRGDLGFFHQKTHRVPRPVVEAAFALGELWSVGGPVRTDAGWVVVMKTGQKEAIHRSLEQEKHRIKNTLFSERRLRAWEKHVDALQSRATVKIFAQRLANLTVPPTSRPTTRVSEAGVAPQESDGGH